MRIRWLYCFDVDADVDAQSALLDAFEVPSIAYKMRVSNVRREGIRYDFYSVYGGFFFLGIILSLVFLTAAAVIIYYKQLSEGYEDQKRFTILRKVGMTREDIRRSINSQMLTVFFFPLGLAVVHLGFAIPMLLRLLQLFSLYNVPLLVGAAAASAAMFTVFYLVVYKSTTSVYYRLVAEPQE